MNSLLQWQNYAGARGLVYTVESSVTKVYLRNLTVTVYFGCDAEDTARCIAFADAQHRNLPT